MPNYLTSRIYKIVSNQTDLIYVGSTTQTLSQRMASHRSNFKRWRNDNGRNYTSSFEVMKFKDAKIILIERVECKDKEGLLKIERKYIESLNCCNKYIPGRTKIEWRQDNEAKIKAKKKQYRQDNKEEIRVRGRKYRQANEAKIKARMKQYRQDNKEEIRVREKQYQQANETKLKQKYNCPCGGRYTLHNKSGHTKTAKHKAYLESKTTDQTSI